MKTRFRYGNLLVSTVIFCLLSTASFSQPVTVVSPVTNQTYKLPDAAALQTEADVKGAIVSAEIAGKALSADAAAEKTRSANAEADLAKAGVMNKDHFTAVTNFNKDDVTPYKTDFDNYNASGAKYTDLLTKYNKAVLVNNALAAKDRKAATVAVLNKQKVQVDSMATQLGAWKVKLDAAKTRLDVKNAALQKQQKKYETMEQTSTTKLKASKTTLNNLLNQMTICANYNATCRGLLVSKFKLSASADTGYFASPTYRSAAAGLYAYIVKLKNY